MSAASLKSVGTVSQCTRPSLAPERLRWGGLFDPKAVGRLVDQHIAGIRDHDSALWTLLVFELWRLEYLGADPTL